MYIERPRLNERKERRAKGAKAKQTEEVKHNIRFGLSLHLYHHVSTMEDRDTKTLAECAVRHRDCIHFRETSVSPLISNIHRAYVATKLYPACTELSEWVDDRENQSRRSKRLTRARKFARIFVLQYDKSINSGISNFSWRHSLSFSLLLTFDIVRHYQILRYSIDKLKSRSGKTLTDMWTVYFEDRISSVLWSIKFRGNMDINWNENQLKLHSI